MHTYLFPGHVVIGAGAVTTVAEQVVALGGHHAFVIADPGIMAAGLLEPLIQRLRQAGLAYTVDNGVVPNPDTESVDRMVTTFRQSGADLIIGVGGGSALDTAKAVRLAAGGPADIGIWSYAYLHGEAAQPAPRREACPRLVAIPTTAGTGAEATPWAVLTHRERRHKYGVGADPLIPDIALLDPELTVGMPAWLTAATGVDALSHLIEAYVSTRRHPLLDPLIRHGIALIGRHLRTAVWQGHKLEARQAMMEAALLGGIAITANWLGACHSLAHQLSSFADVHHGVAIALMLPHQMAFSLPAARERYAEIGEVLDPPGRPAATLRERAAYAVAAVRNLIADIGLPTHLGAVGVSADLIPAMAASAYQNDLNWTTNPRPVTQADLTRLYEQALSPS